MIVSTSSKWLVSVWGGGEEWGIRVIAAKRGHAGLATRLVRLLGLGGFGCLDQTSMSPLGLLWFAAGYFECPFGGSTWECRQKGTRSSGHSLRVIVGFGRISLAWARPACPHLACFVLLLGTSTGVWRSDVGMPPNGDTLVWPLA